MLQGTGSSVGKSLLVAGAGPGAACGAACAVRPFKPQNMSNNAAVTADGGEIGRAQALQARAAGVAPCVHMNPVLLKPQSEIGSQVVVQGRVVGNAARPRLPGDETRPDAARAGQLRRACGREADIVLVEGAGSASEVNLRAGDIANMGFARAADVPVVVVGDIDRGGVIASLVGTHTVLDPADARHGRRASSSTGCAAMSRCSHSGMGVIAAHTGWAGLGLVPFFPDARSPPGRGCVDLALARRPGAAVRIAVPVLPWIANFDDFDPLAAEPGVDLVMVPPGEPLPVCDLVILPGSKATIADLAALRGRVGHRPAGAHRGGAAGCWACAAATRCWVGAWRIRRAWRGRRAAVAGLGLLPVDTVLGGDKRLVEVTGESADGVPFRGYEMHVGRTSGPAAPMLHFADGRTHGRCHLGGRAGQRLLRARPLRRRPRSARPGCAQLGADAGRPAATRRRPRRCSTRLAAHVEAHVDVDRAAGAGPLAGYGAKWACKAARKRSNAALSSNNELLIRMRPVPYWMCRYLWNRPLLKAIFVIVDSGMTTLVRAYWVGGAERSVADKVTTRFTVSAK